MPGSAACQRLGSQWETAAAQVRDTASLGMVDCSTLPSVCQSIHKFPTILAYRVGAKPDPIQYLGDPVAASIVGYIRQLQKKPI